MYIYIYNVIYTWKPLKVLSFWGFLSLKKAEVSDNQNKDSFLGSRYTLGVGGGAWKFCSVKVRLEDQESVICRD